MGEHEPRGLPPEAYEVTLDVFQHFGTLKERYTYDQVCCAPPSTD